MHNLSDGGPKSLLRIGIKLDRLTRFCSFRTGASVFS